MKIIVYFFALTLYFLLAATYDANATTIVIIVTPKSVILGADSRGSFFDYVSRKETKRDVVKIYKSGKYYFAIAGLTNDPETSFDASQIINSYLKSTADISTVIDSIKIKLS